MKQIEIVPYNPEWPKQFEAEAEEIRQALGENFLAIHHVGSTAVPGLPAKAKIDIIAVVRKATTHLPGYEYRGEYNIPMHYGFSKRGEIRVNLHMYEEDHPEIELNLLFRDCLRKNPAIRDEYAALKQNLLNDGSSFEKSNSRFTNYTLRKGDFIRKVLKEAGFDRIRMLKCNDSTEWAAAERLAGCPLNASSHEHLVLYQGTEIIGYAQLDPQSQPMLKILKIDDNKKDQGFDVQFLALIEKWLKSNG